jgi:K+-sensing histidine kinase KdpD
MWYVLEMSDDGVGIPEPELERLRQPFQRGLGVQHLPGSGLGLTLVNAVGKPQWAVGTVSRGRGRAEGGTRDTDWEVGCNKTLGMIYIVQNVLHY